MSDEKNYLCTLKPIGKFFFGGERTFGQEGEAKRNYLVRSNPFPQQTTLLGVIRYELLKQQNLLPIEKNNDYGVIKNLIGAEGFRVDGIKQDFGLIKRLSPIFIYTECESFLPASLDNVCYLGNENTLITEQFVVDTNHANSAFRYNGRTTVGLPMISNFNHKRNYEPHFISENNTSVPFYFDTEKSPDGVFIENPQIGITKGRTQKDSKGFYKQYFFEMSKKYSFGFYLNTSVAILEQSSIVFMGADRSAFVLTIKETKSTFESTFKVKSEALGTKITLLSDTYVKDDIYTFCKFSITETVPFKNIETSIYNKDYHRKPTKTNRILNLLKKGSVLYPASLGDVKLLIDNEKFKSIGYNIYTID